MTAGWAVLVRRQFPTKKISEYGINVNRQYVANTDKTQRAVLNGVGDFGGMARCRATCLASPAAIVDSEQSKRVEFLTRCPQMLPSAGANHCIRRSFKTTSQVSASGL